MVKHTIPSFFWHLAWCELFYEMFTTVVRFVFLYPGYYNESQKWTIQPKTKNKSILYEVMNEKNCRQTKHVWRHQFHFAKKVLAFFTKWLKLYASKDGFDKSVTVVKNEIMGSAPSCSANNIAKKTIKNTHSQDNILQWLVLFETLNGSFFADVIYLLSRLNKILEYEDLILGYFVNLLLFGWKIESNGREKMMEIIQREKRFNMWQKYFLPHKPPLKNQNISWKE